MRSRSAGSFSAAAEAASPGAGSGRPSPVSTRPSRTSPRLRPGSDTGSTSRTSSRLFLPATFPSAGPGHAPALTCGTARRSASPSCLGRSRRRAAGLAPAGTGASSGAGSGPGSVRGAALVSAGVRQPQVEEDVLAHQVAPAGGAERAGQALGRGQPDGGAAAAQEDGGDEQLQPVEPARREEAARRVAPALDQQPAQAALAQGGDDAGRGELPGRSRAGGGLLAWSVTGSSRSRPSPRRRTSVGAAPSCSSGLVAGSRPLGSTTTRTAFGPSTWRVVRRGSSRAAVLAPTITASQSARVRCRWTSAALPLM